MASRPRPSTEEVSAPRLVGAARGPEIPQLVAVCQALFGESQMLDHAFGVPRALSARRDERVSPGQVSRAGSLAHLPLIRGSTI